MEHLQESFYSEWILDKSGFSDLMLEMNFESPMNFINCNFKVLGRTITYPCEILRDGLGRSETVMMIGQYFRMTTDFTIKIIHYYNSLQTKYKRIIYSLIFSVSTSTGKIKQVAIEVLLMTYRYVSFSFF